MSNKKLLILLGEGKRQFNAKNYNEALDSFNEALRLDPFNIEALLSRANVYHLEGNISKAIKGFREVLNLQPDHTDASISLSVLLNDIGKYEEAKSIFDKINNKVKQTSSGIRDIHIDRKFSAKHFEMAELYATYRRHDEAIAEYDKAIILDQENLQARLNLAQAYNKKGYINKAIEELKKLKADYPAFLEGKITLGLIYYSIGKVIEAETEWLSVLNRDPKNVQVKKLLNISRNATETTV